jgi:AraC family transcriptional regulator
MSDNPINSYDKRINRVCEYIDQNINQDLTLDALSDVAAFSKYHFHRVFLVYTGMSVTRYIQLARLKRASYRLAFENEKRVIDIALEAGFESPEAFARAFKRTLINRHLNSGVNPIGQNGICGFNFSQSLMEPSP